MFPNQSKYNRYLIILIVVSTAIRMFIAGTVELGNDEVYYRLYALYPDWSHFDHPLMVGLVIQLFSLNLLLHSEFFLRLGAIVIGVVNIWLMFRIGKTIKDERTGFYAAFLYVTSIYASIISGTFILPDTPQGLFWLLSIYIILYILPHEPAEKNVKYLFPLLGLTLGLGILSKYTTVFLWLGIFLYFSFYRRDWLKSKYVYLALTITLICILPIMFWNIKYDFISFAFQGGRVAEGSFQFHPEFFFREILGEVFYNNPVNFVLIVIAVIAVISEKLLLKICCIRLIILTTIPLIVTMLLVSLFRSTLPHWSAPAYTTLLLLAAGWLDQKKSGRIQQFWLSASALVFLAIIILGYIQVQYGLIIKDKSADYTRIGSNDPSLDMYGFKQVGSAFEELVVQDRKSGVMPEDAVLVGDNWFPLANYDYYAASPLGMQTYGIGDLNHIHKYAWINREHGGLKKGMSAYYITDSRYYHPPDMKFKAAFETVEPADTIQIYRGGKVVKRAFVFRLKNLEQVPEDPLSGKK
ncbi:MAG: glycosyltransferase family 39 protein [Chlorobi bacterium]|nr:glycosyltransferase family 39 protein [Chlorobiota bacterium]